MNYDSFIDVFDEALTVKNRIAEVADLRDRIELEHYYEMLLNKMAEMAGTTSLRIDSIIDGMLNILRGENAPLY